MVKRKQPKETKSGCKFCTDPDFAFRHTLEDDALLRIAEIAVEVQEQLFLPSDLKQRLAEALKHFHDLDAVEAQEKRAIAALIEIADDLDEAVS